LVASAAVVTHPLTGIFAFWFFLGLCLLLFFRKHSFSRSIRYASYAVYSFIGAILTPLLLGSFLLKQGVGLQPLSYIRDHLSNFTGLFTAPYYFFDTPVPFLYDLIYTYRWAVILLLIGFAIYGYFNIKKKTPYTIFIAFPLIIVLNAFFASTWITVPNLQVYEQLQYAERLMHVSMFFIIPLSLFGMVTLIRFIRRQQNILIISTCLITAIFLSTSFYLTYPQKNPKVNYKGFNVTKADSLGAQYIHKKAQDKPYIVLSNIMGAAAAIDLYGFLHYYDVNGDPLYYYSIPTGGELYDEYLHMLYEGQKREYMYAAMDVAGVDTAYFVLNKYWIDFPTILEGAIHSSDEAFATENGNVWVFRYSRTPSQLDTN